MSAIKVYFAFSTGLQQTLVVPKGTKKRIIQHVSDIEEALALKVEQPVSSYATWDWKALRFEGIDDETLCYWVGIHNDWVRLLYEDFSRWAECPPIADVEELTPDEAATFWHALQSLEVPPHRWSREYYKSRMQHFYEVLRGREDEGVSIDCKPLTSQQANEVVWLFSFLDKNDIRLEVPKGGDELCSSDDGEYDWCEKCGAVYPDDANMCVKRKCPIKIDYQ